MPDPISAALPAPRGGYPKPPVVAALPYASPPRTSGGHPDAVVKFTGDEKSSPHERGSSTEVDCLTSAVSVLPVYAGVIPGYRRGPR
jgi:hypothetical protein